MTLAAVGPARAAPWAVVAMFGSALCWGGATVLTKGALASLDPFVLLSIQLTASVAALWTAAVLMRVPRLPVARLARAGSTGVFEPGLAYAVGVPGLALTSASNASVIAALEPVFILIGAWLVFRDRPGLGIGLAIGVAVVGAALVSLGAPSALGGGAMTGDALILAGTMLAAVYVLASSRLAGTMPAVLLTAAQQSVGLVLVLGLTGTALALGWQALPLRLDLPVLALAVGSGLIQYALAFWLYIVGLRAVGPAVAGLALTTTPVFGVLGGIAILGEGFTWVQAVGMALVVAALSALLRRRAP